MHVRCVGVHRGNEIGFAGDSAGQHIVVARQVLSGRMEHQIRPQRDRLRPIFHHGALGTSLCGVHRSPTDHERPLLTVRAQFEDAMHGCEKAHSKPVHEL